MDTIKKTLRSPYLYIFLATYYAIWLLWSGIKLPFHDPAGIISYLPSIQYNPANNVARFVAAVLLPPLACLIYWFITESRRGKELAKTVWIKRTIVGLVVVASILLALCMGIVQGSTNPSNNPVNPYGGPSRHAVLDTFHEGETLGSATSYAHKDLKPYRDFVLVHGVFQDPVSTLIAFKVFGHSIGAVRAFTVTLLMATFVLYYLLLLVLFRGNTIKSAAGLGLLAILMLPNVYIPWLGNYVLGNILPFRDFATILFLITAVLGFRSVLADKSRATVAASGAVGFIAVATFANSIDRAFYIFTLSLLWLAMLFTVLSVRRFVRSVLIPYFVGALAGTLVLGIAIKWAFSYFLSYLLTMSRYKEYLDGVVFTRPNTGVSLVLITVSVGVFVSGAYLIKLFSTKPLAGHSLRERTSELKAILGKVVTEHYVIILLFATAVFFLRSAIGRALPDHFYYSVQWLYLLLAYLAINYAFSARRKKYHIATSAFVLILFGSVCLGYAHAVKAIDLGENAFPIHVKDKDLVRSDYRQSAKYLRDNLSGDQTFMTLTSEASWYYLVGKPSPVRYQVIWYAFTASQRQEIANALDNNNKIKYVVTNNNWTSNFDYIPNPVRFPEVYSQLQAHYKPIKGIGQQTIWIRK